LQFDGVSSGLSQDVAAARLAAEAQNEQGTDWPRTKLAIASEVAREPMFPLLLGARVIYLAMDDVHEASLFEYNNLRRPSN
jgi:Ca2+-transporting ATPase